MTDREADGAYETFRGVVYDLIQPIITDVKESFDDRLMFNLSGPKSDLSWLIQEAQVQGQNLRHAAETLDEFAESLAGLSTKTDMQVRDLGTAQASFREDLEALHDDVSSLSQRVELLQQLVDESGRVAASRDRRTQRIVALTAFLILVNVGIALWALLR